ncbi:MAG: hypothetical protein EO766_16605 [Hydrotalea sp. AMD]|uniref:hypothetical protein n=1 Tax=Hydrotalea sp. AMD TaxID=2501297 RepID=UPI0010287CCE|nr:hypothetical protein [Hydrotalea sp. AMD]RWZ85532.1 MAG: hypothetical protein EO766_16605 [Hydrotalea sp. AMD]
MVKKDYQMLTIFKGLNELFKKVDKISDKDLKVIELDLEILYLIGVNDGLIQAQKAVDTGKS